MVILHEHDGVVRIELGRHGIRKALVDNAILIPVRTSEYRLRGRLMTERPQRLVCKPVVVAALFLFAQPEPLEKVGRVAGLDATSSVGIRSRAIGRSTRLCDPQTRAGTHHRFERGDQPTHRMPRDDRPRLVPVVNARLAIGDDNHALAVEAGAERVLEAARCPGRDLREVPRNVRFRYSNGPEPGLQRTTCWGGQNPCGARTCER